MLHRGINCLAPASLAVFAAAFCNIFAGSVAARDLEGSAVRYVDAPSASLVGDYAALGPVGADPISLGTIDRGSKLKFALAPSASVGSFSGGEQKAGGVEVRFGSGAQDATPADGSWFVFAGAKKSDISYDMSRSAYDVEEYVQLDRQAKIGDLRAGVTYQMGPAQMALGYMKRTYRSGDLAEKQHYAAFTLSLRR